MIIEALKRSMVGIAFGGIITFIAITIVMSTGTETSVSEIWFYMLCSYILGIYFGLSSFIFGDNSWSQLQQTIIHFTLSILFYFIIALSAGWIKMQLPDILVTTIIFIIIYLVFWTGYYWYYKKVEESMNKNLRNQEKNSE
ncbi:DUF3021 domain-containing protein [Gracilibacillus salinarum]|uniref:DUF3021 domain-containing protein n=1 Tax=Gracilibacillus salinarum TaxID=2932255 RepID=A0ABY4GUB9_9BACI|nr:DUF3021 domain-containing protein [Gracilibacillus salinarum]UOQ86797.1 DUF3021 domain-containing protein [Gracilibacillus salinarum]